MFYVATVAVYGDPVVAVAKTTFKAGETAFVVVSGVKPGVSKWRTTWLLPSLPTACADTRGRNRPASSASGTLSYDTRACPAFGSGNEGVWRLRLQKGSANFVVLTAFTVDTTPPTDPTIDTSPRARPTRARSRSRSATQRTDASLQCDLDGAGFSACREPAELQRPYRRIAHLPRQGDRPAGNESNAASFTWVGRHCAAAGSRDHGWRRPM